MAKVSARVPFKRIRERAAKRKGGEKVLKSLMPKRPNNKALAKLGDDRVLSGHVLLCLRDSGVPIGSGTSKKDLRLAQAQFNAWKEESGLPITHISRTCALSIGENYPVERLKEIMQL